MKTSTVIYLLLLSLVFGFPAAAFELSGDVQAGLELELQKQLSAEISPVELRINATKNLSREATIQASANLWRDQRYNDGGVKLHHLVLSGFRGDFDYAFGRQIINWGTADGFSPTNYFSRLDSSNLLSGSLAAEPLWAGQLVYYAPSWSGAFVFVPLFQKQQLSYSAQKLLLTAEPSSQHLIYIMDDTPVPGKFGKDYELGIRLETQLRGFDAQLSYFSGYESLPGLVLDLTMHPGLGIPTKGEITGVYRRQRFVGLATAGTLGSFGVWGELRWGGPESFAKSLDPNIIRHPLTIHQPYLFTVIGGDYTLPFGQGLLTQLQYIYQSKGSLFTAYSGPGKALNGSHYLYTRISYDFTPALMGQLLAVHGLTEKSAMLRGSLSYRFSSGVHLEGSLLKTYGNNELGKINPRLSLGLKYSF